MVTSSPQASADAAKTLGQDDKEITGLELMQKIGSHIWPESTALKARVVAAMGLLVGGKVVSVQIPMYFKHLIDTLNETAGVEVAAVGIPVAVLVGYGMARALSSFCHELRGAVFAPVAQHGIRKIACDTFRHLLNMDMFFHSNRDTGSIARSIDRGVRSINFALNALAFNVAPTILEIGLVCAILGSKFGLEFAGVTLATLTTYVVFTIAVTAWRTKFRKSMNAIENQSSSRMFNSLINFETVAYFGNHSFEVERYDKLLAKSQEQNLKIQSSLSALNFGQSLIFSAGLTAIMYLAAQGVVQGSMTVGDIVLVNGLLFQLSIPLNFVGSVYRELRQAMIDMSTMMQLQTLVPVIRDSPDAVPLDEGGSGNVRFTDVRFAFEDAKPEDGNVVDGISFDIPAGHSLAVVGTSGAGKSTLLKLLFRFYDTKTGSVTIDGQDLRDVTMQSLRQRIGLVPQDTTLFNDTIFNNIAYGKPEAAREEVIAAARMAELHESIEHMPDGYDTVVGERGSKLSGGEKQRVAIARMILRDPQIVLCDEATSSLDSTTENQILENLKKVTAGKTTIYIAHRLSTVKDCDSIIVMHRGKIVERGPHTDLLAARGKYYELWRQQSQSKETMASEL